ncbi:MAG: hypothetical protein V1754_06600 [Pseudomonadota bacterium]
MRAWMIYGVFLIMSGCTDLRSYEGIWGGSIIDEDAIRQGFAHDVCVAPLNLENINLQSVTATLSTSDGKFKATHLAPIQKAASDALASLTWDRDPLRTYLLFASLETEATGALATFLVSLFGDDHVELRIIRGNDLYGVFHLERED